MHTKIASTTSDHALGLPSGNRLMRVDSGPYEGRLVAILQTSPGILQLTWSDRPHVDWSAPLSVVTDSAVEPFDCVMNQAGEIHLFYSEAGSLDLVTRRLSFAGGEWTVGSPVTIYNGHDNYYPSAVVDSSSGLWVAWSRKDGSFYYLQAKSSGDNGATWGGGATDPGDDLALFADSAYVRLVADHSSVHAVFRRGGDSLSIRSAPISTGVWSEQFDLATGLSDLDQHFDAAVSGEGLIGVVFDNDSLKYREYDGNNWGAMITLDESPGAWPQLGFNANVPVVVYLSQVAGGQQLIKFTTRRTGSFTTPGPLLTNAGLLAGVKAYHAGSGTYEDLTEAAGSASTADVYHTASSRLIEATGDCLYLMMPRPFRYLKLLLSTAGSGGSANYSYFNGTNWQAFSPISGGYQLDNVDQDLLLFEDEDSIPDNWQPVAVDDEVGFWIKIEVETLYATGPVGSMITSISELTALAVRR